MSKTDPYAVTRVKRTVGCTENQGSWPQANPVALWQHAYFFSKVEISNVQ